jgi:hypothetical protein
MHSSSPIRVLQSHKKTVCIQLTEQRGQWVPTALNYTCSQWPDHHSARKSNHWTISITTTYFSLVSFNIILPFPSLPYRCTQICMINMHWSCVGNNQVCKYAVSIGSERALFYVVRQKPHDAPILHPRRAATYIKVYRFQNEFLIGTGQRCLIQGESLLFQWENQEINFFWQSWICQLVLRVLSKKK